MSRENGHPCHINIIHNTPLGCPRKICLIKTLLEKNPMEKKSSEGKRVQHLFCHNLSR